MCVAGNPLVVLTVLLALVPGAVCAGDQVSDPDLTTTEQRLAQVRIPEIDVHKGSVPDVVRFLAERDGVATATGRTSVVFAPGSSAGTNIPITFQARNISLLEALKIVTQLAGLKYRIEGNVVLIVPKDAPDGEVIHKTYDVKSSFGQQVDTARKELQEKP